MSPGWDIPVLLALPAAARLAWLSCLFIQLPPLHPSGSPYGKQTANWPNFLPREKKPPKKSPGKPQPVSTGVGMLCPIPAALPASSASSTSPFSWVLAARGQIFSVFLQPHVGSEVSWSLSPPCPVLLPSRAVLWESPPAPGGNYADLCLSCDLLVAGGISRVIYYAN